MADTSMTVIDAAGATRSIDAHSQADGNLREAVVVGDAVTAATATVSTSLPADNASGMVVRVVGGTQAPAPATGRTNLAVSTTSQAAWPDRPTRRGGLIFNFSDGDVYLAFATTASVTAPDLIIPPGAGYELPNTSSLRITGPISVVWLDAAATGSVRLTEWTV